MPLVTDQLGRQVDVPARPRRIVSLVPSQTELLFDLGLGDAVVGVTKFCVHPAGAVSTKESIGGPKQFRFDVLDALRPDLIIGNKEENYQEGIERLAARYPVWISDVRSLPDALDMIRRVGQITGRAAAAEKLTRQIDTAFAALHPLSPPQRVAYFIWRRPYMVAGGDTFIDDMLARCGLVNAFAHRTDSRYPEVTVEQLQAARLDRLLLSSEPFPFAAKHQAELEDILPGVPAHLMDGELFSWYGSRLRHAVPYLTDLIDSFRVLR